MLNEGDFYINMPCKGQPTKHLCPHDQVNASETGPAFLEVKKKIMKTISERIKMGSGQIESISKYNSSKTGSLNKASQSANTDIVKAHVGWMMEDLELWPAEERTRLEGNQRVLSGARAAKCEGIKVSH